jgi:hypothetical protein
MSGITIFGAIVIVNVFTMKPLALAAVIAMRQMVVSPTMLIVFITIIVMHGLAKNLLSTIMIVSKIQVMVLVEVIVIVLLLQELLIVVQGFVEQNVAMVRQGLVLNPVLIKNALVQVVNR